jgi:hypothetical protein
VVKTRLSLHTTTPSTSLNWSASTGQPQHWSSGTSFASPERQHRLALPLSPPDGIYHLHLLSSTFNTSTTSPATVVSSPATVVSSPAIHKPRQAIELSGRRAALLHPRLLELGLGKPHWRPCHCPLSIFLGELLFPIYTPVSVSLPNLCSFPCFA